MKVTTSQPLVNLMSQFLKISNQSKYGVLMLTLVLSTIKDNLLRPAHKPVAHLAIMSNISLFRASKVRSSR